MSYDILKQQIRTFSTFSDNELNSIISRFSENSYNAKEFILTENKTSTDIHFIVDGLVRTFYVRDGKEITTYLASDHGFISAYSSFITQTRSVENIQCIEKTTTLSISYQQMEELYKEIPNWQMIGRILAEQNYLCMANRILKLQAIPAKEKYIDFLATSPDKIIQRTPLIHIASFLGITPESLSRIRKTIS